LYHIYVLYCQQQAKSMDVTYNYIGTKSCNWIQSCTDWRRWSWKDYFCQETHYWLIRKEIHCYPRCWG